MGNDKELLKSVTLKSSPAPRKKGEIMIEVHHLNNSRSQRILWLLEELKTPYEIVSYQRDSQSNLAPDSLMEIHPLGLLQTLKMMTTINT